ncbi:hypothetical protein PWEIH_03611 [Listeria weihenstephanensis FSL R9-0317]|uniref:Uncharacterized protein n=1 Tax=Listeria weihenstephanensis TaxID=1006155 RepID=A0A1S7FVZ4_9LIST|nr:hypothetical protein [Listeria weihenstephanensis]AQY51560.1 hypothetical protein UE46_11290 [Listeria weihenstephanensis]EUJ40612.1 hypothetical protein PWEIH_03611 [Listeria weihenstephanensis FSL R9-0317]
MAGDKRFSPDELNEYNKKQLNQAYQAIARGMENLETPQLYKIYLEHVGQLQGHTLNNSLLIHEAMPNATKLETYDNWGKKYNLQVSAKSKSMRLLKHSSYEMEVDKEVLDPKTNTILRDEAGNAITKKTLITIPNYKTEAVFDIEQTKGERTLVPEEIKPKTMEVILQTIEKITDRPLSTISDMSSQDQHTLAKSAIEGFVEQQLTYKKDVFVKDERGVTTRIPKSEAMEAFEKESAVYAICHNYGVAMDVGKLLGLARDLDKSDRNQFKGLLESVHHTTMSAIKQLDGQYKSLVQEKNQGKEAPQKTSILDKLSQNKDVILQKDQSNPIPSKTKEMGLS